MTPLVLFLPWPPSINRYWRSPSRHDARRIISAEGRKYRADVIAAVLEQLKRFPKPILGPVEVTLCLAPPDSRRRDLDNALKAPLDACTHAGLWKDDSQVKRLVVEWADYSTGAWKLDIGSIGLIISPLTSEY